MNKSRLFTLLGVLILSLAIVGIAIAADNYQAPPPVAFTGLPPDASHPDNVLNSRVDSMTPDAFASGGQTTDVFFHVVAESNDAEYMDGLELDLPDDWTVNTVYDVTGTGCGAGHTFGVEAGNEVFWMTNGGPGTGCGDWLPGEYDFGINVTVPAGCTSPWDIDWHYFGDTWGVPPHEAEGSLTALCAVPGLFLLPETQDAFGCNGLPQEHDLTLVNFTGTAGTFDMTYAVIDGVGTLTGPATLDAEQGASVDFTVTLSPDACGDIGDTLVAQVGASGNTYTDTAVINKTIGAVEGWTAIDASKPTWGGSGYPRDGCTAQNAAGEWVTYEIGDVSAIFGFWGYNHDTNTWALVGADNTPADRWAPDWAYDADENLCYLTGGASAAGGGTYTESYVFDPVENEFTALGSFTSARDFHTSWVGTINTTKYLCIGGGVNAASVLVRSTQCYDLAQTAPGVWNAENAQMPQLPTDPFGSADGLLHAETGDQFWYTGGAVQNFGVVTDEAWYFDDADDAWHLAGNTGAPAYRVEGDFVDGEYYQVDGSTGGFSPSTVVAHGTVDEGVWTFTLIDPTNNARMDNVVAVTGDTLWSVDGYGASATAFVEKLGGDCVSCSEVPVITIDPTELNAFLAPDETVTKQLNVCNIGGQTLEWSLTEKAVFEVAGTAQSPSAPSTPTNRVALSLEANGINIATADAPLAPAQDVSLILDDGSRENDIGIGGTLEFIYLNRFTPAASDFPFELNQIQVYFSTVGMVNVGDDIILVVYENTAGNTDPAVGSNWLASFPTTVQALDTWNVYNLTSPVTLYGPGDVLVGVIALEVPGTSYWPASIDQTATQARSWAGWWNASPPPTPPVLPPDADWTLIDAYFPGNWMLRGYGDFVSPDVLWLSETPITGTVAVSDCMTVDVTFDSTGLALGTYNAELLFDSNAPFTPEVVVPVTLVVEAPAPAMEAVPASLEVELNPGDTITVDLVLNNTGNVHLDWTGAETVSWLSIDPTSGTLPVEGSETIAVTFDSTGLTGGDHLTNIVFTSGSLEVTVPVNLKVLTFNFSLPFIWK